ncbi:MAG: MaoC family dehydratase [Dehalococcoidia bacterium]|tara:strand:- start:943 stop:1395 length:453 start_codon:yes stop_codon:yes gene_type:complete
MGIEYRNYNLGDEITPLVKTMSQEAINDFEGSAGVKHPTQFTDTEFAQERLGTAGTIASGRMSVTFCLELMRRNFGADSFNRTGMVDLRNLRPVRPGNTITFTGKIIDIAREANGNKVTVEINATNDDGNLTGVGKGSVIVPSGYFAPEE